MNRNINKAIADYQRLARKNDRKRSYQLYFSDVIQILDKNPTSTTAAVTDAMEAGFSIGYKAAKKELKGRAYYTAADVQAITGKTKEQAAAWIREKRAAMIQAGQLPPEYPKGIIPAATMEE
jgi:hypothetical protein